MKLVTIIFSLVFISSTHTYKIQQFPDFAGIPEIVESDSSGNVYAVEKVEENRQLWKINPSKEVLWKIKIPEVYKIIINNQNNVYVVFLEKSIFFTTYRLTILNEETAIFQEIDRYLTECFVLDDEGNLIYSQDEDGGVYLLRPNSTSPILIKNLEYYRIFDSTSVVTDIYGNTYLQVSQKPSEYISVITKDAKQEDIPHADVISFLAYYRGTESLVLDQRQNLYIMSHNSSISSHDGYIDKLVNKTIKQILNDKDVFGHRALAVEDRIYVISWSAVGSRGNMFFINLDDEMVQIPGLTSLTTDQDLSARLVNDKDGNLYFGGPRDLQSLINSSLGLIKYGEMNPIAIQFEEGTVKDFLVDEEDNLWILQFSVYHLKKGEVIAEKLDSFNVSYDYFTELHLNKKTNEVYILTKKGLYYVSNDSN